MKKRAWMELWSAKKDACVEGAACDLDRALSLVRDLDNVDRSRCLTFAQQRDEDEGTQVPDHDRVGFSLSFGTKVSSNQGHSKCCMEVDLVRPSGYNILLTVPRFFLGLIPRPFDSFAQYETVEAAASREQLTIVIRAFYERPDKDLLQWSDTQPHLQSI